MGGVQYTVDTVGFATDNNKFELRVNPALPFDDSFTLTLAATQTPALVKNTGQLPGGTRSLTSAWPKRAQAFTTGSSTAGYTLGSIGLSPIHRRHLHGRQRADGDPEWGQQRQSGQ